MVSQSQQSYFITTDSSTIHYKVFGKGKPVLIINGGPGLDCEGFQYVAQQFAQKGFQAIIFDQRGTGKSVVQKADSQSINIAAMVADIETIRKQLQIKQWAVLGHSFGGLMAVAYAHKHETVISHLIFSSSGGLNLDFLQYINQRLESLLTKKEADSLKHYEALIENGDTSLFTMQQRAKYMAPAYVYKKEKASLIADRLLRVSYDVHVLVFEDLQKQQFDVSQSFQQCNIPVLVLQGYNDVIAPETAQKIAAAFPHSTLILMKKCGHYGWLDVPKKYWKTITDFLNPIVFFKL